MKLRAITLALTVILPATTFATESPNSSVVLKPVNDKVETQACYLAATEGANAARSFLEKNNFNFVSFKTSVICNGVSIAKFAEKFAFNNGVGNQQEENQVDTVKLVALDNRESQLCVDAVVMGVKEAREKHNAQNETVYCNRTPLGKFAREYRNKIVSL